MRIKVNQILDRDLTTNSWIKAIILEGEPKESTVYELKEIDEQTDLQRKLFNPLCRLYYDSLCHNRKVSSWLNLRNEIKKELGCGYEKIRFTTSDYAIHEIAYSKKAEIPKDVIADYRNGNTARVELILKSMSKYSKKEMTAVTDSLIREMIQNLVLQSAKSKQFQEILEKIDFQE